MLESSTFATHGVTRQAAAFLLCGRAVSQRVVFSLPHIARLERIGAFPARRILGPGRIGWHERDVTDWMQRKLDERGQCHFYGSRQLLLTAKDRFLSKREVSRRVIYSPRHIDHLEREGQFPRRIRIGAHRSAWLERDIDAWIASRPERRIGGVG